MLPMTDKWRRLADQVARRRGVLGLTQVEVAQRGPMSLDRVQAMEGARGSKYRPGTIAAFERALEWEHGSIAAILAGGDPTPKEPARGRSRPAGGKTPLEQLDEVEARYDRIMADPERRDMLDKFMRSIDPNGGAAG